MLFSSKKDLVGIDVGSSSVKLVKLRESRGNYQLFQALVDDIGGVLSRIMLIVFVVAFILSDACLFTKKIALH